MCSLCGYIYAFGLETRGNCKIVFFAVAMASFKEGLGIIIESQKIADAQKQIFELAWEATEKYQKRKT